MEKTDINLKVDKLIFILKIIEENLEEITTEKID